LEARSDNKKQAQSKSGAGQTNGSQKGINKTIDGIKQPIVGTDLKKVQIPPSNHPKNPIDPGKLKGPLKPPVMESLKKVGGSPDAGPGAWGASNTMVSANFLPANQRQDLTNLLAANPANLGEDDLKAVQAALDYDARAKREERYLELENATGERLTVWLHYQTFDEEQQLSWYPTKPVDAEKALQYVLEPETKLKLSHGK